MIGGRKVVIMGEDVVGERLDFGLIVGIDIDVFFVEIGGLLIVRIG